MKIQRDNPIRICAGLFTRLTRSLANSYRLHRLRRKGLQCPSNTYIYKGCTITNPANVKIGANCCIGDAELLSSGRITIGDRTIVGTGAYICTGSHDTDAPDFHEVTKPISIGSHVWIATRATVLPGVKIGDGAVIGMMAVVADDVPAGAVVFGNPAWIVRTGRVCPADFDPLYLASVYWRNSLKRLVDSLRLGQKTTVPQ